jgi:hypothetical protein
VHHCEGERDGIASNDHIEGDSHVIVEHACKLGHEGLNNLPYESGRAKRWLKVKNPKSAAMKHVKWIVLNSAVRQEEAELHTIVLVDEQNWLTIRGVFVLNDVRWDDFPLAVLEVLPLIRPIGCDAESGFKYVTVFAATLPGDTDALARCGVHFLFVIPFVVRHRSVVSH